MLIKVGICFNLEISSLGTDKLLFLFLLWENVFLFLIWENGITFCVCVFVCVCVCVCVHISVLVY